MKKNIFCAFSMVLSLVAFPTFASNDLKEEDSFKGNWTKKFHLKDGTDVVHTPQLTSLGFMSGGKGINIASKSYNGIPMDAPLNLKTNSTEAEFVAALRKSGLYNGS